MLARVRIIIEIIKKEFHQILRDKRMLATSFAPVLQVLLLGYAATTDIKNSDIVVCDLDKSTESRTIIRAFTNSHYFIYKYSVDSPDDVDHFIDEGKAKVALIIPVDFGNKIIGHRSPQLQLILDGADANTANILLGYATQIVSSYSQNILLKNSVVLHGTNVGKVLPEARVWFNTDLKSQNFMVPGVLALVLMITTMTLTSLGIVKEKEIGTLEQLLVTPIKPYQLIVGKLIPFVVIAAIDVMLVLAIARFWFDVPLRGNIFLLFGLSGLFILTTLGLGIFISTISRSQQQAMLIAQFFFFMPLMFFSGFTFPISNMPVVFQYFTYLLPLRYYLEIVRGIFLKGAGIAELWPEALALFVFGIAILTLSTLRFRKKLG